VKASTIDPLLHPRDAAPPRRAVEQWTNNGFNRAAARQEAGMVRWTIKAKEFVNCNCAYSCPCQFNARPTHGNCRAFQALQIEQGHHGDPQSGDGRRASGAHRAAQGFEYTVAEMGRGWAKITSAIKIDLADSYGQFANIHLCQSGLVH
jgi:hypothetical protein